MFWSVFSLASLWMVDGMWYVFAGKRRRLSQIFFSGEECALENMERLTQDLLPQVHQLDVNSLIAHVATVHAETQKPVWMKAEAVFLTVRMPGFNLLPDRHDNHYVHASKKKLLERWTNDLKKHAESCVTLKDAFAATRNKKAPVVPRAGAPRSTRSSKSMAEPQAPPEVTTSNTHMSKMCPAGRKAHVLRIGMSARDQKRLRVDQNTHAGEVMLEAFSHAEYGEVYPAIQEDSDGTERDLEVVVGKDCFEHKTPREWRALGHPPVMRCHCIGVTAWEGHGEPEGAFDYSVFHDDFSVETFDWDKLVGMELVRVPEIYVTEEYTVWWKNPLGDDRELTKEEYRGDFGHLRPKHLRTTPFWERM